jgi:nicotinamidase-related amidase
VNELFAAVRATGGTVIWTRQRATFAPGKSCSSWYATSLAADALYATEKVLRTDPQACELWPALNVRPDDVIMDKYRFSAFTNTETDLSALLRRRSIDTLAIVCTFTHYCCQSTARDASMHDYRVIMPPDANADLNDPLHNPTCANLASMDLCDLRMASELKAALESA